MKRRANRRYRANVPEFVAWLKPQVVKFVKFEPALMSMTVLSGAEVEVRVCLTYLNLKKQKKNNAATGGRHIYTKIGHLNAITKDQKIAFKRKEKSTRQRECLLVGRLTIRFFAAPTVISLEHRNYSKFTKVRGEPKQSVE